MRDASIHRVELRRDLVVAGLLALFLSAFYFDILFLGNNLFTRDLTTYHYPMKKVVRDTILDGEFPAWNPQFSGGQPMAANPAYEVFYPPQWLTLIPDYNLGFRLHILFHAYLAALGMFAFLRSRGVRRPVAFIGGMAFVLCGPFVSVFYLLPFLFSVAWTPWIALFVARYFETRSRLDLVMAVCVIGMQSLICEPTTLLQTWFLLGLYGVWQGWQRAGQARVAAAARGFVEAVGVVVAGVTLAAVQFLPALDHAADSVRRSGFAWEAVSQWSFPPLRLVEIVFPSFLGVVEHGGPLFWGHSLYPDEHAPYLASVYIGLLFFALVIAGLVTRRRGAGFVLLTLGVSFVLAAGSWTPLLRVLYDAGLLPSVRYPEKFILSGTLVALAWGCMVLNDVLEGDRRASRITTIVLCMSAVVAAAMWLWSFQPGYADWFATFWPGAGNRAVGISQVHWMVAVVRGIALAGVLELVRRSRSRLAAAPLLLVLVADLGSLGNQVNPRMPARFFDPPAAVSEIAEASGESRLLHLAWLERDDGPFARVSQGYESAWAYRNGLVPMLPAAWGVPTVLEWDFDETHLLHTREFLKLAVGYMMSVHDAGPKWRADAVRQIAGMCNVGVVAVARDEALPGGELEAIQPVKFERVDGGQRYYFAGEIVPVHGPAGMFEELVSRRWRPSVAFVEAGGLGAAWGRVHSVRETSSRIDLEVEALGEATLVASVTRHKYWRATVDGEPVPILPVNHAFQGVPVGPGRHRVELRYFNPLVPVGGIVTVAMAGGLFVGVLRARRRPRQ